MVQSFRSLERYKAFTAWYRALDHWNGTRPLPCGTRPLPFTPEKGEQNSDVLSELGFSDKDLNDFKNQNII